MSSEQPSTRPKTAVAAAGGSSSANGGENTSSDLKEDDVDDSNTKEGEKKKKNPNLDRKMMEVKRPPLGHIVPQASRMAQKKYMNDNNIQQGGGGGLDNQYIYSQYSQGQVRSNVDGSYSNPNRNLKILGGTARGRKLDSPPVFLRPMMGKVREAVYSTFTYFQLYNEKSTGVCRHLDIFAGSGSVGLESLSRGAKFCTFVDLSPDCCDSIVTNLRNCHFQYSPSYSIGEENNSNENQQQQPQSVGAANIICGDALQVLRDPDSVGIPPFMTYQIVTLCPPYEEVVYGDLIDAVAKSRLVTEDTIVLIEYPVELGCLPHIYDCRGEGEEEDEGSSGNIMVGIRNRRYGRTVIAMYIVNPTGKLQEAESRPEEFVSLEKNKTNKKNKKKKKT